MRRGKSPAVLTVLATSLTMAAPALGFGPAGEEGDQAVDACIADGGVVDRQVAAGIQAGGGPKSIDVAPTNCDHFWQDAEGAGVIGNGHWPPPPFVE
jgi:hypothetical protein